MTDRTLPGIGLKGFWALGEDNWKDDMDANLLALSVLVQGRALSLVNATPGSPTNGDVHLFGSTHPTQPNKLAVRDNGAWVYYTPLAGWRFYNIGTSGFFQFNGVTWTPDTAALTAEDVRDVIAAALVQGTNVTIVNDDPGDTITISAAGGGSSGPTDEQIQDMIATFLLQGSNVTLTYDDTGNHLTIASSGGGGGTVTGLQRTTTVTAVTGTSADSQYVPAGATAASASASAATNLSITFTITTAQTVGVDFFAIISRTGSGSGRTRVEIRDTAGTKVWPKSADAQAYHKMLYSTGTTETDGQVIEFHADIALAAGTYTWVLYSQDAGSIQTTTWYDRNWSVTYQADGAASVLYPSVSVPAAATFSLVSGDATNLTLTDDTDVGILVDGGAPVAGGIGRVAYKTLSNKTLAWDLRINLDYLIDPTNGSGLGIYLMDSIGGKLVSWESSRETGASAIVYWASLTGLGAGSIPYNPNFNVKVQWLRVTSDGTNFTFYISENGKLWSQVLQASLTAWLANKPDRVGFGMNYGRTTGMKNRMTVRRFELTGAGV